ncbi:YiaA/YiaB family inner membrane protein [Amycolatopsis roodepoortensis]|uniref:YiaA/YiaB family inner membrane protein n=1 Tax=Amycolatopsis roodepoortensis TaxID=700274 RepID=UPI00214B63D8|nr:YiaA/YiaB family inner membrane protein [Amycolatopsis roodepoortensis]UUV28311.1 YiaA/YiaB family inner membrane protein [Amycolatopsis roodepoortensis]
MTKTSAAPPITVAFFVQAALSFGLALLAVVIGIWYLPVDGWVRGFLALGMLFLTTSAFTLAKCVRDRQDENTVVSRVDQARVDKLLAEHDPFKTPAL